ncbi:MAG TPA: zf-HC2 domain-containing protein [Gemmatimonadaceae bacterium]|nr:zf-HC2 domain-containing protein [Gemmatimonadaceae bacterium]
MTNEPMTCDVVADQLASYMEGELPEPTRLELEAHAAACDACSSLLADLDAIRHEASVLPMLEPSRDLWAGIAARIDTPVTSIEDLRQVRPALRRTWLRPGLAAAALILVTAGVTHYFTRAYIGADRADVIGRTPSSVAQASLAPASEPTAQFEPSGDPSTESTDAASNRAASGSGDRSGTSRSGVNPTARLASAAPVMKEAEPVYDQEIGKLRAIVKERRSQLDPKTIAVLEQSIAVIDSAIAQSRAALAKDPSSGFLATQLNQSLDKKVELLRMAASLPSRT